MSVHDENDSTVYKCQNCNKYYTDHFTKEEIEEHTGGKCKNNEIIIKDLSFRPETRIINIKSGAKYDLYIGRANLYYNLPESKWANKYIIGKDGTREDGITKYFQFI